MSDWTKIIGAWPGDETDEEVDAFLNPPDAHEGMMTRREVLEKVTQTSRALCMADSTSQVWWNGYLTGLSISAHIRGQLPEQVRDAAHELALLMNAEREEAQGNE